MKIYVRYCFGFIVLLLYFYSVEINASAPVNLSVSNQSQLIQAIRNNYNAINIHQKSFRNYQKLILGISSEGALARYFKDGKNLKKIILMIYGETGRATYEYYFDDNVLSFYYEKMEKYNRNFGKVSDTSENRYYFYNNRLIEWLDNSNKTVNPDSASFKSKENEILKWTNLLKKIGSLVSTCVQISSDEQLEKCPR